MTPIFDTAILKYHRVEYGNWIETEGAKRSTKTGRNFALAMIAMIAVTLVSSFTA